MKHDEVSTLCAIVADDTLCGLPLVWHLGENTTDVSFELHVFVFLRTVQHLADSDLHETRLLAHHFDEIHARLLVRIPLLLRGNRFETFLKWQHRSTGQEEGPSKHTMSNLINVHASAVCMLLRSVAQV